MSALRNLNSRRDAPHERAELIDHIAAAVGAREFAVSIDGRAFSITLEAYLGHLSNAGLVELGHAASAAALCVTRLVASQDGLGVAGPRGDVDEVAKQVFGVAADLVRLEALGLDTPMRAQDLAKLVGSARTGELGRHREAEPDGEASEKPPVGVGGVAGAAHVSLSVSAVQAEAAAKALDCHDRREAPGWWMIDALRPILDQIAGAAT